VPKKKKVRAVARPPPLRNQRTTFNFLPNRAKVSLRLKTKNSVRASSHRTDRQGVGTLFDACSRRSAMLFLARHLHDLSRRPQDLLTEEEPQKVLTNVRHRPS